MVPIQMRAGGAFIALAVVLVILAVIAFFTGNALFTFTPATVLICIAALLFGAFVVISPDGKGTRTRFAAQLLATLLIIVSLFIPDTALFVTQTYWLVLWAGAAVLCALVLRRSIAQ